MTEDNAGEMIDHLTDYLEGIEAIANKVFKTKNGKQQVNSLLAMITSLLNSLQLKEFDRERAHRAETLAEQIDDELCEVSVDVLEVVRLHVCGVESLCNGYHVAEQDRDQLVI